MLTSSANTGVIKLTTVAFVRSSVMVAMKAEMNNTISGGGRFTKDDNKLTMSAASPEICEMYNDIFQFN